VVTTMVALPEPSDGSCANPYATRQAACTATRAAATRRGNGARPAGPTDVPEDATGSPWSSEVTRIDATQSPGATLDPLPVYSGNLRLEPLELRAVTNVTITEG
jgi:hypothetical protein